MAARIDNPFGTNTVNLRAGDIFVRAASSRDSSFSETSFHGWKPLPPENDVKFIALIWNVGILGVKSRKKSIVKKVISNFYFDLSCEL